METQEHAQVVIEKSGGIGVQRLFFIIKIIFFFNVLESLEFPLPSFAGQFSLRSVARKNHNIERL